MKKRVFLLFLVSIFCFSIDEPIPPQVEDNITVEIPKVPDPFQDIKTNTDYFIKTRLYIHYNKSIERVLFFSNINISITNYTNFSLYEISKIEIKKWKATLISNNLYLFTPEKYNFYFYNKKEPIEINGNIEMFNILQSKEEKFYTFFYDYWISGKNKYYRWKNSRSVVFDYNFTHPLENVVFKIEFLW
ncbi:MAG: hypothetical protein N2258_01645 [Brevinematales bacterium]|nr:hypothetical protein [Brevinematales bacterium]